MVLAEEELIVGAEEGTVMRTWIEPGFEPVIIFIIITIIAVIAIIVIIKITIVMIITIISSSLGF